MNKAVLRHISVLLADLVALEIVIKCLLQGSENSVMSNFIADMCHRVKFDLGLNVVLCQVVAAALYDGRGDEERGPLDLELWILYVSRAKVIWGRLRRGPRYLHFDFSYSGYQDVFLQINPRK